LSSNPDGANEWVATTPKPAAERTCASLYPLVGTLDARYADIDANGHLNNLALESMHEEVRAKLNTEAFPGIYSTADRTLRLVTSQNVVHFLAESHWPAAIQTGVGVGRIGRTSYVASSALFLDGSCISVCDAVLVAVGLEGPVPIPDAARETLGGLMLRGA
jgi:acyl-CoA thioester hydrolase